MKLGSGGARLKNGKLHASAS
ncbi:hypothetical protein AGR7B_pAt0229 [Agrobacterium deltaense RV3]|nr:hypothetical protein AGR7B_pAt0229 [Agrobacterium deltaense RV3]